jgi:PqqD family protein of HPr-rel-A system
MSDLSNLKNLAISETGFVFDPRSGATYSLNPTALLLVAGIRQGASLEALVKALEGAFEGVVENAREDVLDFVQALRRQGLVPADFKV